MPAKLPAGIEAPTTPADVATPDAGSLIARFESVPFSGWHAWARIIVGSATFFDAFDALSIAYVLPVLVPLWHLSTIEVGFLIAASYIGQVVGALLFSRLGDIYGRIPAATAAVAIMSVMSLGCVWVENYPMLFAFRLLQGIGVGGEMPVAAAYIGELSRAHGRGRFFLLYEMIFPVGLMAAGQIGTLLVPVLGWKIMFLIGGIPGLVICLFLRRLPESPRWLVSRGRLVEAEAVIRRVEASTPLRRGADVASIAGRGGPKEGEAERSRWRELIAPAYRRRSLIVWILWAAAFLVTNSLNNWAPTLYNTVYGLGLQDALRAASLNNVAQVVILLICAVSIDRIGRRNWTAAAFAAGALLLAVLGVAAGATQVIVLTTLSYGIIGSVNAVLYLYTPEIYPTRIRAIGVGVASFWLRVASAAGPPLVGFIVVKGGVAPVFLLFGAIAALAAVAATGMIETRGRTLEDIAA